MALAVSGYRFKSRISNSIKLKKRQEIMIPDEVIMTKIFLIRRQKVIISNDLADLFGVTTKRLNEQVKRNIKRFPQHFMFQLTEQEKDKVVANCDHLHNLKYSPYLPYVFTEHGTVMLANILNSDRAIQVSIRIVEIYIKIRENILNNKDILLKIEQLEKRVGSQDEKILLVFKYLKKFIDVQEKPRKRVDSNVLTTNNRNNGSMSCNCTRMYCIILI